MTDQELHRLSALAAGHDRPAIFHRDAHDERVGVSRAEAVGHGVDLEPRGGGAVGLGRPRSGQRERAFVDQ